MVWEAYYKAVPLLGVPGITLDYKLDLLPTQEHEWIEWSSCR